MKLENARVLISGAGSGLGRACAIGFGEKGARVIVSDLRADGAAETVEILTARGVDCLALQLDVTSEDSWAEAMSAIQRQWGGLDVLVNNAGVATAGTVEDAPIEQWQWVFDINLMGCVRGSRAAIPLLKQGGAGHIVNIASFAGIANPPAMASYNAAKAAVISLSETLRFELYPNIGVSVACPSFFKTDLLNSGRGQVSEDTHDSAPQMMSIVGRLMEKATVSAQDVAGDIVNAVASGEFLVISHADARMLARLKRLSPELYFRRAQKSMAGFLQKK